MKMAKLTHIEIQPSNPDAIAPGLANTPKTDSLHSSDLLADFSKFESAIKLLEYSHEILKTEHLVIESDMYFYTSDHRLVPPIDRENRMALDTIVENIDEEGITDWVAESGQPKIIPNLNEMFNIPTALIIAPFVFRQATQGLMIAITSKSPLDFSESDLTYFSRFSLALGTTLRLFELTDEIRNYQDSIKAMNARLMDFSRLMTAGELSNSIAEETDNLLKVINANFELMETGIGDDKRRLKIIKQKIADINSLTSRLLMISGEKTSGSSLVDLADLADKTISVCYLKLQKDDVRITQDIQLSPAVIRGDEHLLLHVLLNLILKSKKSMPEGGEITLGLYLQGEKKVSIVIADNGTGLNPEFKADDSEEDLFFLQDIIKQQKGKLSRTTEIGKGTTYRLILPLIGGKA